MTRAGGSDVARATVPDMTRTPRRIAGRLIKVVAAIAVVLGVASLPSSAAEDPDFPGLPAATDFGTWVGPRATALNASVAARQWFRLPPVFLVAWNRPMVTLDDPSCRRLEPYRHTEQLHATAYFISTDQKAPEAFGHIGPFTVRTVAFGSIPVQARVLVSQPRDEENLPVGFEIKQLTKVFCAGRGPHAGPAQEEAELPGMDLAVPVEVSILGLKVDGVDLDLQSGCAPQEQSTMKLSSPTFYSLDPDIGPGEDPRKPGNLMSTPYFALGLGGLLTGDVDIAAFVGCRTGAGEDVSRLLTSTISGRENPVVIRSEGLTFGSMNCAKDRAQCTDPLPGLPYPDGLEGP